MELFEFIRNQIGATHWGWDDALGGLTEEQFNWTPPGTTNSIAATALHAFGVEDGIIQANLLGQPLVWETGAWANLFGMDTFPDLDNGWTVMKGKSLTRAAVMAYGQAVLAATDRYLAALTSQDLDRSVKIGSREGPCADLLSILVIHTTSHNGELAVLLGLLGFKGQPV